MANRDNATRRTPLNRDRVLRAAIALADEVGIDSLSMRNLAERLGVVPMALYKHVTSKDELLNGMIDVLLAEIDPVDTDLDWKPAVRRRILAARRTLQRHTWAARVLESRPMPTPAVLAYADSMIGIFRAGGLSVDLTHHVMHALGSRMLGFSQELFDSAPGPAAQSAALPDLSAEYPHIVEIATRAAHDEHSVVGPGCDDQFEFEFALDLLLDGFERLWRQGWSSTDPAHDTAEG